MKIHLLVSLLCCSALSLFAQAKYPKPIRQLVESQLLDDEEALYIIAINSNDCVNCLLPLGNILKELEKRHIDHVAYVIDGIDPSEKNKYVQQVMQTDPAGKRIYVDKAVFRAASPDNESRILIGRKGKILYDEKIKALPDDQRLSGFLSGSTKRLSFSDSTLIEERYLRGAFATDLVNAHTLASLNTKYQEISLLDLHDHTTKTLTNHSLRLNIDSLLSAFLSTKEDSALLRYNLWLRHQPSNFFTRNPLFPDIDLMNLSVQDDAAILVVGIPILNPSFSAGDTSHMISKIPFLAILDVEQLRIKDMYSFSAKQNLPPEQYIASLFVPFYLDNSSNQLYFKTSFEGDEHAFSSARSIMACRISGKQICFDKLLEFIYPSFFTERKLYNNYNNCGFSQVDGKPFFYFTFVPDIYDLSSAHIHQIKNSNYQFNEFDARKSPEIRFKMQTVFTTSDGYGACYISEKRRANLVYFDKNWNEISRSSLPDQRVLRVINRNRSLFVLTEHAQAGKVKVSRYRIE